MIKNFNQEHTLLIYDHSSLCI